MGDAATDPDGNGIPTFVERGDRPLVGGYDHYECPECAASVCSYCDCPECGWYDAEAWEDAIEQAERNHDDIYTATEAECDV